MSIIMNMVFSWFKKNQSEVPMVKYKKMSRKDASEDLVKLGEDLANDRNHDRSSCIFRQGNRDKSKK